MDSMESIVGLLKRLKIRALIGVLLQVCAGQLTNSWGGLSAGQDEDRSGLGGGANITAVWVGGHRLNIVADPDPDLMLF
jgi:hypothetical protein